MENLLRIPAVEARTGLSRSTIYLRVQQKKFPTPIPLGSAHAVGWLESEIESWISETVAAARAKSATVAA